MAHPDRDLMRGLLIKISYAPDRATGYCIKHHIVRRFKYRVMSNLSTGASYVVMFVLW